MKKIGDGSPQVNLRFRIRAYINKVLYNAKEDDIKTETILQEMAGKGKPVFDGAFYKGRKEGIISDADVLEKVFSFYKEHSTVDNSFEISHALYELSKLQLWNPHEDEKTGSVNSSSLFRQLFKQIIDSPEVRLNEAHMLSIIELLEDQELAKYIIEGNNISLDSKAQLVHIIGEKRFVDFFDYFEMLTMTYTSAVNQSNNEIQERILGTVRSAKDYECKNGDRNEDKKEGEAQLSKDELYRQVISFIASKIPAEKKELRDDLILSLKGTLNFRQIIEKTYQRYKLSPDDRIDLICRSGDERYIDQLIRGEIQVDKELKKSLYKIITSSEPEDYEERKAYYFRYAKDDKCLTNGDRLSFMLWSGNTEELRKFLETHKYNSFDYLNGIKYLPICLLNLKDDKFREDYINDLPEPARTYLKDKCVEEARLNGSSMEDKKFVAEWDKRMVCISSISELNMEDVKKLPDDAIIKVFDNGDELYELYSKETYCKILEKINERFGSIPKVVSGDKNSEVNTLQDVCMGMSGITYNNYAISPEGEYDWNAQIQSRNLEGPVLMGTCVCAGFANALKNIYILKGGIATFLSGTRQGYVIGHAWNQVKIGDCWFNVDVTSRISEITWLAQLGKRIGVDILDSDEILGAYIVNDEFLEDKRHNCNTDIAKMLGRDSDKIVDKNPYDERN